MKERVEQRFDDITELALVRYTPDENWDIRLGRLGLNAYIAADSRRIDYAHLWLRPPKSFMAAFSMMPSMGLMSLIAANGMR